MAAGSAAGGGLWALPSTVLGRVMRLVLEGAATREELGAALRELPLLSKEALAALQELRLPVGRLRARSVEDAVRQATAAERAWDLHTLDLRGSRGVTDVSALAGCAALHTLNLRGCDGVTYVSALTGLHELQSALL